MCQLTTATLTSILILSKVPQTSESTSTNPIPVARLGELRAPIQITVDELRDLMKRFRVLTFEGRNQIISEIITNILPITQAQRNGLLGRGVSSAGEQETQAP
jgi:hypothetical protein